LLQLNFLNLLAAILPFLTLENKFVIDLQILLDIDGREFDYNYYSLISTKIQRPTSDEVESKLVSNSEYSED